MKCPGCGQEARCPVHGEAQLRVLTHPMVKGLTRVQCDLGHGLRCVVHACGPMHETYIGYAVQTKNVEA